jgi:hypothetical protein
MFPEDPSEASERTSEKILWCFQIELYSFESFGKLWDLADLQLTIIVSSTTGDGEQPEVFVTLVLYDISTVLSVQFSVLTTQKARGTVHWNMFLYSIPVIKNTRYLGTLGTIVSSVVFFLSGKKCYGSVNISYESGSYRDSFVAIEKNKRTNRWNRYRYGTEPLVSH